MNGACRFSYCILSLLKLLVFLVYYYSPVAFFLCALDVQIIIIVLCFTGVNALIIHALIELQKKIVVLCRWLLFCMFVYSTSLLCSTLCIMTAFRCHAQRGQWSLQHKDDPQPTMTCGVRSPGSMLSGSSGRGSST